MADPPSQTTTLLVPPPDELGRLRAEHAATVQALQAAIRDTTRLTRLFAILNEAAPLEKLLDRVLATLSELFLVDVAVLLQATPDGGFTALATIGVPPRMEKRAAFSTEASYTTAALKQRQAYTASEAESDPRVDPYLRELDAKTVVWLPVAGDQPMCRGVLVLVRCRPLPFVQSDIDLLMAMAYRIGLILERAHAEDERRTLEARFRQAEKTESLGRMAAAIAHHFNNMLGVVVGRLDLALEELSEAHVVREDLVDARESARRAAKTSELMLAYLGQSVGRREAVDLTELMRSAIPGLRASVPPVVQLTLDLRDAGLVVLVSPSQMIQLLSNLVTNAWEAMRGSSGEIHVSVRAVSGASIPESCVPSADWKPKAASYVCLEVRDTGCGMAADTLDKIFDPFFTTKFVGRGLGLPVVLGTLRAYDGMVCVDSIVGQGTTVRVFLPYAPIAHRQTGSARATTPAPVTRPSDTSPGSVLVLVADDEPGILQATQRMLARVGYQTITAPDGAVAVEKFRQRVDDISLAILDISMPRMDGWSALAAIRALRSDVPVILTSGYDHDQALDGRPQHHALSFLHKPYTLAELRDVVAKAIEEGAGRTHCL